MGLFICARFLAASTKTSGKFAVAGIDKKLVCKSYADLDIGKMKEQVTLSVKFSENDFHL